MMSYFDDGEPRAQRVIRLLDAWLRDDTPPHVWQGLVKLGELEDAVYRFIFLGSSRISVGSVWHFPAVAAGSWR